MNIIETKPKLFGTVGGKTNSIEVEMYNKAFKERDLDFTYLSIDSENIYQTIDTLKEMKFKGISVSNPYKINVIGCLDELSEAVKNIGACNTIINKEGRLIGHNTDHLGAKKAIEEVDCLSNYKSALIIGSGGAARAIAYTLITNNIKVYICSRNEHTRTKLVNDLDLNGECDLNEQDKYDVDIVVNATPFSDSSHFIKFDKIKNTKLLIDVSFNKLETYLINDAKQRNIKTISGWRMLLYQAAEQFEMFTNEEAPIKEMEKILKDKFK